MTGRGVRRKIGRKIATYPNERPRMEEPAIRHMTLAEFLRWEDGTDTRYELIGGFPMAMVPPARAHGMLCARLAGMFDLALRSHRPCSVQTEAGIVRPDRDDA